MNPVRMLPGILCEEKRNVKIHTTFTQHSQEIRKTTTQDSHRIHTGFTNTTHNFHKNNTHIKIHTTFTQNSHRIHVTTRKPSQGIHKTTRKPSLRILTEFTHQTFNKLSKFFDPETLFLEATNSCWNICNNRLYRTSVAPHGPKNHLWPHLLPTQRCPPKQRQP